MDKALALGPGPGEPLADEINLLLDTEDTLSLTLGDVDGDLDLDVVEGKRFGVNRLYLNDGTGALGEGIPIGGLEGNSQEVLLTDINGDGFADLIVADSGGKTRFHMNAAALGMGATNLDNVPRKDLGEQVDSRSLAVGLVDGDALLDLVVGINGAESTLFRGTLAGGFDPKAGEVLAGTANSTTAIALADVDGDGNLDLIQGNNGNGGGATNLYYPGDGLGAFGAPVAIGAETDTTRDITVADLDGAAGLDVVVANIGGPDRVYLSTGGGAFAAATNLSVSDQSTSVTVADFDGAFGLDIVTGVSGAPNQLYLSTGAGAFAAGVNLSADTGTTNTVASGAMDAGGTIDVLEGNNGEPNVTLTNNGAGVFTELETFMFDNLDAEDIQLADVDGDNDLDLIEAKTGSSNRIYLNDGAGNFSEGEAVASPRNNSHVLIVADVDEDTLPDIVVGNGLDENRIYLGTGMGAFDGGQNISGDMNTTRGLIVADLDGMNGPDIVTGNVDAENLVFLSTAPNSATFGAGVPLQAGVMNSTWGLAVGDLDGLNGPDIVVANRGQQNRVYLNTGAGTFGPALVLGGPVQNSRDVELADLDGDGSLDIVIANSDSAVNHVYLNDGNGGFPAVGSVSAFEANQTWAIDLVDVDNDGDTDVISGNFSDFNLLFLNDGSAGFTANPPNLSTNSFDAQSLATGDVNGDGSPDLVIGHEGDFKTFQLNGNPTTLGITDVVVNKNAVPTDIDLSAVFADPDMLALVYTVPTNTNAGLVATAEAAGTLTLTYTTDGVGEADITVRATDVTGLFVESTFKVTVNDVDTEAPVITLVGNDPLLVPFMGAYVDPGATALDNLDGDITAQIVTVDPVDVNTAGDYTVTYDVSDLAGNPATQVTRTVTVLPADVTAPVITVLGSNPATTLLGDAYVDAGATATDDVDGDISGSVTNDSGTAVDINTEGDYTVTFTVTDAAGNVAMATRTVTVSAADTTAPVITVLGLNPLTITQGSTYTDAGATASDDVDGNLTAQINVTGLPNTAISGAYTVTYTVTDAAGNMGTATRTVTVRAAAAPASSGGGGGSSGLFTVLGMLFALGARRRRLSVDNNSPAA